MRTARFVLFVILTTSLVGCSLLSKRGETKFDAIKTGEVTAVGSLLELNQPGLASLFNQQDISSLGVMMPISLIGDPAAPKIPGVISAPPSYWVICLDRKMVNKCTGIPLNAEVHIVGRIVGPIVHPSKLTAEHFDD